MGSAGTRDVLSPWFYGVVADQSGRAGELWNHGGVADVVQWGRHCWRVVIGAQSTGPGADPASQVGAWSGALVLELLAVVPFLCAVPPLFHELAHSRLLHVTGPATIDASLGASELLPAVAILPFMIYELAGFGTLHFVVSKAANWILNIGIICLIIATYVANREAAYGYERRFVGVSHRYYGDNPVLRGSEAEAIAGNLRCALPTEGSEIVGRDDSRNWRIRLNPSRESIFTEEML